MKAPLGHIQFNVRQENLPFYRDLLVFLGWELIGDGPGMIGLGSVEGQSLCFSGAATAVSNDYDGPGMNHLAFAAASVADVDEAVAFLTARGVASLFETPRHRPEHSRQGPFLPLGARVPRRVRGRRRPLGGGGHHHRSHARGRGRQGRGRHPHHHDHPGRHDPGRPDR